MGRLTDNVRTDHPAYQLERVHYGFILIRRPGNEDEFNRLARSLIDAPRNDQAVFPTSDDRGYERLFVVTP